MNQSLNLTELLEPAVSVICEKRYRENHFAPAVVTKYQQSATQFDWWITEVLINGVPIAEWREAVDVSDDLSPIPNQPYKSKAQAQRTTVESLADRLEWIAPSADGYDSDEYIARWETIVASLQGANK
jgi:hypothetical protein